MSISGDLCQVPITTGSTSRPPAAAAGDSLQQSPATAADPRLPLLNLSTVRTRMDSVQRFLRDSINSNTLIGKDQMEMVSAEISSAIHQTIVNGAALLACSHSQPLNFSPQSEIANPRASTSSIPNTPNVKLLSDSDLNLKFNFDDADGKMMTNTTSFCNDEGQTVSDLKVETVEEEFSDDWEIIELDAVELLAEHIHFCDICGKGFKRDANLRMHMRAHGNQFKTPEALVKPEKFAADSQRRRTRFSCPFSGCNRNKSHKKFRPLKSVICVKNHFKRSHCPKMYSCDRCNKKSFSVVADLKSHLKHCGEAKWKCSCGTSFSRKDKLFGHMALFEGHMPAVVEEDEKAKGAAAAAAVVVVEDDEDEDRIVMKDAELGVDNSSENGFFEGLLEGFGSIDNYCIQDLLDSPTSGLGTGMNWIL